jgi:S-DNA-T family DNA segregation ATPase FtsK/SpoIIIE
MAKKYKDSNSDFEFRRPQLNLKKETRLGVAVVVFLLLAVLFVLSLSGSAGAFGQVANQVLKLTFGWMAYGVPIVFLMIAYALFKERKDKDKDDNSVSTHAYVGAVFLTLALTGLLHIIAMGNGVTEAFNIAKAGRGGGYLGVLTSYPLLKFMGLAASTIVILAAIVVSLLVTFNVSLLDLFRKLKRPEGEEPAVKPMKPQPLKINNAIQNSFIKEQVGEAGKPVPPPAPKEKLQPVVNNLADSKIEMADTGKAMTSAEDKNWKYPDLDMLEDAKNKVDSGNIEANVSIIQKTLGDFGIDVEMGEVNVGPTVTQYTFRPAVGVKLSQIAALQNDLALALAASPVRMELPIPGKALVGIEIPNKTTAIVRLKEIIGSKELSGHESKLAFALGRDVAGHPMVGELARMPHLLIAGATGSGKSIALNSLLISMLYRATPADLKFIIVDPKRVEMSMYNGIPHLLTPIITDHQQAVNALRWAVLEMDRRYRMLAEVHKRNLEEYNAVSLLKMPYIVVVVDELADLMSLAQKDVESNIVRLAQMARAVGIHLVLATQRPSVDVITGLIKANVTARMAFTVASQVDSRTILDSAGAEKLLGRGDMLFLTSELPKPKRIQGAFVTEKEVKKVTDFLKEQIGDVIYNHEIVEKPKPTANVPGFEGGDDEDELLQEAIETVQSAGKASASLLQRRLRVGYARAARLLDILEDKGIIGPGEGAKPREVYGVTAQDREGMGDGGLSEEQAEFERSQKGDY